jgi:UDP-N-acetylmuramate-alanine ligase
MGYCVSGYMNDTEIPPPDADRQWSQHRADHLGEADVVVVSSAIKVTTLSKAARRLIPVIPRAEMGELMHSTHRIAGAHGKTTTTTMIHTV